MTEGSAGRGHLQWLTVISCAMCAVLYGFHVFISRWQLPFLVLLFAWSALLCGRFAPGIRRAKLC